VKAYRFGPDHRAFADPDHEPENRCYCPSLSSSSGNSTSGASSSITAMPTVSSKINSPQCAPHGTFNVSLCQYGKSLSSHNCAVRKSSELTALKYRYSYEYTYMCIVYVSTRCVCLQTLRCCYLSLTFTWVTHDSGKPSTEWTSQTLIATSFTSMCNP